MKITNRFDLPAPIVRALTKDDYSRGKADLSVTQIIDSPRVRLLRKQHDDKIEEDVSDMVWSVLGRAAHKVLEDSDDEGYTVEERLFAEVEGWVLSGAIDLQKHGNVLALYDYKVTSAWSVIFGKSSWETQLNCYAYLLWKAKGEKVGALNIIAILRDWNRREAGKDNYPASPIMEIPIQLWSVEEQERYVTERVRLHQEAESNLVLGDELPLCSAEERWEKATTYAVRKKTQKRAVRVFKSMDEAEAFLEEGQVIDVRQGESTRCAQDWCRVSQWCSQYQEALNAGA
jgi:hypothetical protein